MREVIGVGNLGVGAPSLLERLPKRLTSKMVLET